MEPTPSKLWDTALKSLSDEDLAAFELAGRGNIDNPRLTVDDALTAALSKRDECLKKRWKVRVKGKTIVLRDVLDKLTTWIQKFIVVGDTAMQYDTGYAALPWAAIRFFLQITVNDVETFCTTLQSVERVSHILVTSKVIECLYLQHQSSEELAKELQDGLTAHYRAILVFLAKVTQHYTKHTAVRIIQSVVPDFDALQSTYESIVSTQASLDRLCALVSGENIQALSGSLTRLRLEQAEEHGKLHDKLERLLWTLLTPINRLDFGMNSLHDNLDRQTKSKILRAISTQPYGAHQKAVAKDRLPGSGQWLLELQSYQDWRTESSPSVLWLHGMPGCGKSKLVSLVVEDVQKADRVAFFYCMRNPAEPQRAECDKILASLVRQLACPSAAQPILPPVLRQYEAAVEGFGEFEDQIWSIEESTRILIELSNIYPSVTLVIDALDEVNQAERPEVLSALDEIMAKSDNLVKVFIASRDNIDIWLRLNSSPNVYIDVEHNKKDIAQFIKTKLDTANLLNGKLSEELREKVQTTLAKRAQGMFRWVELQIQALQPLKLAEDIEWRLGNLPKTLEESYWVIYQRIQENGPHASRLATFTFQWLLYSQEGLDGDKLAKLASIALQSNTPYTKADVLDVCENLVKAPTPTEKGQVPAESFVQFVHLSVREFLEVLEGRSVMDFQKEEGNAGVATACLRYMAGAFDRELTLKEQEIAESDKFCTDEEVKMYWPVLDEDDQYAFDRSISCYALHQWSLHLQRSGERMRATKPLQQLWQSFYIKDGAVSTLYKHWCCLGRYSSPRIIPASRETLVKEQPFNPIWIAIDMEMLDIVSYLYAIQYPELFIPSTEGETPLFIAVQGRKPKVVECLLEQFKAAATQLFQSPDTSSKQPRDALSEAAGNGDLEITATLLEKASPSQNAIHSAWISASKFGRLEIVRHLIKKTGDPGEDVKSRAFNAATAGNHANVMLFLLENGLQIGPRFRPTLNQAVAVGHKEAVSILLDRDLYSDGGPGPLCVAIRNHYLEISAMLLEKSPKKHSLSKALIVAVSESQMEIANRLIALGAEKEGPAIIRAIRAETRQTAINLVEFGYDVQGRYLDRFRTALHWAAEKGYFDVVTSLINHKTVLDVYDAERNRPLHLAAAKGHMEVVKVLLAAGADALARDRFGLTPLDLATKNYHEATAKVLVDHLNKQSCATNSTYNSVIQEDSQTSPDKLDANRGEEPKVVEANSCG